MTSYDCSAGPPQMLSLVSSRVTPGSAQWAAYGSVIKSFFYAVSIRMVCVSSAQTLCRFSGFGSLCVLAAGWDESHEVAPFFFFCRAHHISKHHFTDHSAREGGSACESYFFLRMGSQLSLSKWCVRETLSGGKLWVLCAGGHDWVHRCNFTAGAPKSSLHRIDSVGGCYAALYLLGCNSSPSWKMGRRSSFCRRMTGKAAGRRKK